MTDNPQPPSRRRPPESFDDDLAALRRVTERERPSLSQVIQSARRARRWRKEGDSIMSRWFRAPRGLAVGATAAAVVAVLLLVPISYSRTSGHEATVSLTGASMEQVSGIAQAMKGALGGDKVLVKARQDAGATTFELETFVPVTGKAEARAMAEAFADGLRERGFEVSAAVAPRVERVSGSVYAFARDRVIRIESKGRTAAEIEEDIRRGLADAGITDAQVTVTDRADGMREIKVMADREMHGDGGDAGDMDGFPEIVITHDGEALDGETSDMGVMIRIAESPEGRTMQIRVRSEGRSVEMEIPGIDALSDEDLQHEIESRFEAEGLEADVQVRDGQVQIMSRDR